MSLPRKSGLVQPLPRKSGLVKPSIHKSLIGLVPCGYIYESHFECHDSLMLDKSPIKWRQRPDMTIAVDWDVFAFTMYSNKLKYSLS